MSKDFPLRSWSGLGGLWSGLDGPGEALACLRPANDDQGLSGPLVSSPNLANVASEDAGAFGSVCEPLDAVAKKNVKKKVLTYIYKYDQIHDPPS